jgi:uncharacterized protein
MTSDADDPALPVPSPCVGICCIGHDGYCIGCYRSALELAEWACASDAAKREILARCRMRRRVRE